MPPGAQVFEAPTPREFRPQRRVGRVPLLDCYRDFVGGNATIRVKPLPMQKGKVYGPAKLPLFDPIFLLCEHDRPDHGIMARTADRAVPVTLTGFLAVIRVPFGSPPKQ